MQCRHSLLLGSSAARLEWCHFPGAGGLGRLGTALSWWRKCGTTAAAALTGADGLWTSISRAQSLTVASMVPVLAPAPVWHDRRGRCRAFENRRRFRQQYCWPGRRSSCFKWRAGWAWWRAVSFLHGRIFFFPFARRVTFWVVRFLRFLIQLALASLACWRTKRTAFFVVDSACTLASCALHSALGGTQGLGGQQRLGALGGIVGIARRPRGGYPGPPGLGDAGLQVVEVDFLFVGEVGEGLGRVLDLIRVRNSIRSGRTPPQADCWMCTAGNLADKC